MDTIRDMYGRDSCDVQIGKERRVEVDKNHGSLFVSEWVIEWVSERASEWEPIMWINEWVVFFDCNFNMVVMMQESRKFQEDGKLEFLVSSS